MSRLLAALVVALICLPAPARPPLPGDRGPVLTMPLPLRVGAVSDYTGALDRASRDWLTTLAGNLPGADLAVAFLPGAGPPGPAAASRALAAHWRLGRGFPAGGVLVAFYLGERTVQVVPCGPARYRLPQDTCRVIARQVIAPYCRQGRFGDGAVAGCYAVTRLLGANPVGLTGQLAPSLDREPPVAQGSPWRRLGATQALLACALAAAVFLGWRRRRTLASSPGHPLRPAG